MAVPWLESLEPPAAFGTYYQGLVILVLLRIFPPGHISVHAYTPMLIYKPLKLQVRHEGGIIQQIGLDGKTMERLIPHSFIKPGPGRILHHSLFLHHGLFLHAGSTCITVLTVIMCHIGLT